jgi:FkbM family methyltransferase
MRIKYLILCIKSIPKILSVFVFNLDFSINITFRRVLLLLTGRFIGPPIISSITGEKIFNTQSLIGSFAMQVVGELDGPWMSYVREKPSPVVFDVGSNIGQFGALVRSLNPGAEVYTWDCWRELGNYVDKTRHQVLALSYFKGIIGLKFAEKGWTATTADMYRAINQVDVKTETLDNEWERMVCPAIDVLKIDIDGGELDLLKGAQRVLPIVKFVIIETLDLEEVKILCPGRKWTSRNNYDYCGELV